MKNYFVAQNKKNKKYLRFDSAEECSDINNALLFENKKRLEDFMKERFPDVKYKILETAAIPIEDDE